MKRFIHAMLLASLVLMQFAPNGLFAQGSTQKYSLAVLNLSGGSGSFNNSDVKLVTGELTRGVSNTGMFFTMSEIDMEKGLLNNGLDADIGCSDVGCATRAGKALGVQLVVFGELRQAGPGYAIEAKMLHVASGEIVKSEALDVNGGFKNLLEEMPGFAQDLMGIRSGGADIPTRRNSEITTDSYSPDNSTQSPFESTRPQNYEKGGGSKWLYIGLGALVAGGVGAGVLLLTGDDGGNGGANNGTTTPTPTGNLGGPPTFP